MTSYEFVKSTMLPTVNFWAGIPSERDMAFLRKNTKPGELERMKQELRDESDTEYWRLFSYLFRRVEEKGEKIFIIKPDVLDLFRVTDFKSIPSTCLIPPFGALFLSGDFFDLSIRGRNYKVDGFIIFGGEVTGEVFFGVAMLGWYPSHHGIRHYEVVGTYTFRLPNTDDVLLADSGNLDLTPSESDSIEDKNIINRLKPQVFGLIANIFLYINSTHSDARQEAWKEIDSRVAELEGKERGRYIAMLRQDRVLATILGETIKLDGQTRKHLEDCRRTNQPLSVRFMVRGHWRHQWYGSKADGTRHQELKWIQPFWKGDADLPYANKPYELALPDRGAA